MAGQEAKAAYADDSVDEADTANDNQPAAAKLLSFLDVPNLVTMLDEEKLGKISADAIRGYKIDDTSREDWKKLNEAGLKLASLIVEGPKDSPFPGASNVKAPLITTAALQFNARAYPALVKGDDVVKCRVNGMDPSGEKGKRATRVSQHSSWQMLSEMPEWEPDTDRLTLIVAISGTIFRKRYWDPTLGRQCSRLVLADRFVYNYRARSIEDCPRISEEMWLYPYEIQERIRDGRFAEFEYGTAQPDENDPNASGEADEDGPHKFIEQHRLLDLDEDGYAEPYIVTIHLETEKVCRIVCNFDEESVRVTQDGKIAAIRKRDYYVQYLFFPSPDGGAYGMGLGTLMGSTNEAVNTAINELIDAGNFNNTQSGFAISGSGLRDKVYTMERGKFKTINTNGLPIQQAVMPFQFPPPSPVLFQMLQLMMEFGKDISSTADVMTGDTGGKTMAPTTTLALIEQGMQVFSAIFKRLHRSLGRELELHADLNKRNLSAEAYNQFFDDPEQKYDPAADYDLKSMDITPVSDPSVSTNMQKLAKANVAQGIAGPPGSKPWINYPELDRRALEAAEIPDMDKLFVPPPQPDPKQQAFMEAMQSLTIAELVEKVHKSQTAQLKDIADAEAAEAGQQLSAYDQFLRVLQAEHGMEMDNNAQAAALSQPGGLPGMEGQQPDAMGAEALAGPGAGAGAGPGGLPVQLGGAVPAGMGSPPASSSANAGAM